jgi:hypothetical protein
MKKFIVAAMMVSASALVMAKLPAPNLTPEAKLKADEAAAKAAYAVKVGNYQLCKSQERVAKVAMNTKAPEPTPPCADPGAFVFAPPEMAKPIEASGAHSPAPTAAAPPSTNVPSAVTTPDNKGAAPKK